VTLGLCNITEKLHSEGLCSWTRLRNPDLNRPVVFSLGVVTPRGVGNCFEG